MMLSRRIASASPGARGSIRNPSPSGPLWRMAAAIARTRDSASLEVFRNATPQIPHTPLFYLRGCEKSRPSARHVRPQMEARNFQLAVGVPCQRLSEQEQNDRRYRCQNKDEEGFPLQQQAPVQVLLPAGKH